MYLGEIIVQNTNKKIGEQSQRITDIKKGMTQV